MRSNFRSRGPLLEAINCVFERLMTEAAAEIEYDERHRLHAGIEYPAADGATFNGAPIELHLLPAKSRNADDHDEDSEELERSEIEVMRESPLSLMPEGLLETLTETDVRDLIAYLMNKTQVPETTASAK